MAALQINDLDNAKLDCDLIAAIATSTSSTATDRLGQSKLTMKGVIDTLRALNPRGAWATGQTYNAKDLVSNSGTWYIGLDSHTAGATFAGDLSAHWRPYPLDNSLATIVIGNGATDNSAALAAAVAVGLPIALHGVSVIGTPTTITVPIVDTTSQIFSTASQVTIDNGLPVRPEWFGLTAGCIMRTVNALIGAGGGEILLRNVVYPPSYATSVGDDLDVAGTDYLAAANITLRGSLPAWNAAHDGYVPDSGTILQGPFAVFASGFRIIGGLGVDCSAAVCAALYAGAPKDAFFFFQPRKATPTYAKDVHIEAVYGVCADPDVGTHGVLIEAVNGGYAGRVEAANSFHGAVCKSMALRGDSWVSYGCNGEGVIVKSDDYSNAADIQIDKLRAYGNGAGTSNFGVFILAVGAGGGAIQIGSVRSTSVSTGLQLTKGPGTLGDIQVGRLSVDGALVGYAVDGVLRSSLGALIANNCVTAVEVTNQSLSRTNSIGSVSANSISGDMFKLSGFLRVGSVQCEAVTGYAYNYVTGAARIMVEGAEVLDGIGAYWNLSAALANSWTNVGGGESTYGVTMRAGRIWLKGLIHSGSAAGLVSGMSTQIRPPENLHLTGAAYNGSAYVPADVIVGSGGAISVPNYAAGSTSISLDGLSWPIPF